MAHADSANFASGLSKSESYNALLLALEGLLTPFWVPNLSNAASLLWHHFQGQGTRVNWAGFYTMQPEKPQLILGPFMGKVACQEIAVGSGVCGTAALSREVQLVDDVNSHPNHIACDSETQSEIVVPIVSLKDGRKVLGVIDIDCLDPQGFDDVDAGYLGKIAHLLASSLEP